MSWRRVCITALLRANTRNRRRMFPRTGKKPAGELPTRNQSLGVPICPDFLGRLAALTPPMRLSLMKGAHGDLSSTAWQEIGVKPYFGLSGIAALDVPLSVCHGRPKDKTPS